MKVVEKFISINGEGWRAGELAVFIRFQGCNLRCSYCDTAWAYEAHCPYTDMTPKDIVAYIKETGVYNVTLTGGEPLLQKEMKELLTLLGEEEGIRVEIETNGAVAIAPFCIEKRPSFTMDYKLPKSGWESSMVLDNMNYLQEGDTVKFVCSDMDDLRRAKEIIDTYELTKRCHVYLSPVFGSIEPSDMVAFMIEQGMNDVRLQIQIHKVIWDPEKRGV